MAKNIFILLSAAIWSVTLAFPNGAPASTCDSLSPVHYNVPGNPSSGVANSQPSPPPYSLTAQSIPGGYRS